MSPSCTHLKIFFLLRLSFLVALSLVLLFRAALALVRSVFIDHTPGAHRPLTRTRSTRPIQFPRRSFHDMIHVKWGRDVLHFPVPSLNTPLGKLRADLAAYTQLPVGSFKLVYKGAVMKEDSAPCAFLICLLRVHVLTFVSLSLILILPSMTVVLDTGHGFGALALWIVSTYNLKENATIALIGGHTLSETSASSAPRPVAPAPKSTPQTEEGTILAIRAELEKVRETLVPDVDAFVRALVPSVLALEGSGRAPGYGSGPSHAYAHAESAPPHTELSLPESTPTDHTRLSELLLQSLLRLDALHVSGVDWPEARVQRKAAVREVQGVLDRLDGAWAAR